MTVLISNCTISLSGTVSYTGLEANIQPDGSGDAQIPRLLAGAGGSEGDYRYAYRVRCDITASLPAVGDTVTITAHDDIAGLVGTAWTIWREPETNNLLTSMVMRVVRKIS